MQKMHVHYGKPYNKDLNSTKKKKYFYLENEKNGPA